MCCVYSTKYRDNKSGRVQKLNAYIRGAEYSGVNIGTGVSTQVQVCQRRYRCVNVGTSVST